MLRQIDFQKTPVVEAVNDILVDSSKRGASDIHFDPLEEFMKVRIRIDGQLHDYVEVPNDIKKNLITRIKIISGMNITESRLPQDGAIKANIKDVDLDLRVSSIPTIEGEKIVIRILDYSMSNSGLETLGFSEVNLKKVIKMINVPNGIILITGATGSGKSTTVYSILQRLNKEDTNIITVEDPIEMNISGINQIQTNSEIGLDFATALRSILRQDPNIIMVGEIRDTETAKIAVRASITGHLVLSTIHTNDSLNTIERLLDMDVERYLLSSALTGIISQKLARKLCPHCRVKRATTQYEREIFKKVLDVDINEVYEASGCEICGNGFSGRIAIHEVLMINQNIKDAISSNIRKDALRELVYNSDVITLLQDGLEKVVAGLTTFEEILKIIELEEDEKLANSSSLKKALDYSNIANNSEDVLEGADRFNYTNLGTELGSSNTQENVATVKPIFRKIDEIGNDSLDNIVNSSQVSSNSSGINDMVNNISMNASNVNAVQGDSVSSIENIQSINPTDLNGSILQNDFSNSESANQTSSLGLNDIINNINSESINGNVSSTNTNSSINADNNSGELSRKSGYGISDLLSKLKNNS
jgi:type IV pilus assembly protein PilB